MPLFVTIRRNTNKRCSQIIVCVSHCLRFLYALLRYFVNTGQIVPLTEIQRALHRQILYQLSPTNISSDGVYTHTLIHISCTYTLHSYSIVSVECSSLVDFLCSLTTKLDSILDSLNNDDDFLACLFHCLFRLTEEQTQPTSSPNSGGFAVYVPASRLQMRSAANRVFCKMLELKRKVRKSIVVEIK